MKATEIQVGDIISLPGGIIGTVIETRDEVYPADRGIMPRRNFRVKTISPDEEFFGTYPRSYYESAWFGGNHRADYYCYNR